MTSHQFATKRYNTRDIKIRGQRIQIWGGPGMTLVRLFSPGSICCAQFWSLRRKKTSGLFSSIDISHQNGFQLLTRTLLSPFLVCACRHSMSTPLVANRTNCVPERLNNCCRGSIFGTLMVVDHRHMLVSSQLHLPQDIPSYLVAYLP